MKPFRLLIVLFPLFALLGTKGQPLATAPYLCDSMVLQRGRPLPLTGTARPGSIVEVSFAGHTAAAAKRQVYHAETPGSLTLSEPVATERGTIEIAVGGIRDGLVVHGKKSGFEMRDAEGVWHPARLRIRKNRLELTADRPTAPSGIRYAWGNVDTLTVYHTSGLPLPPFLFEMNP